MIILNKMDEQNKYYIYESRIEKFYDTVFKLDYVIFCMYMGLFLFNFNNTIMVLSIIGIVCTIIGLIFQIKTLKLQLLIMYDMYFENKQDYDRDSLMNKLGTIANILSYFNYGFAVGTLIIGLIIAL